MSNQLKDALLAHRLALLQRFKGLPECQLPDSFKPLTSVQMVFPNSIGTAFDADNFRREVFLKVWKESGLPRFRFHDIRHTFASLLLQQGESLHYVKEQMGHASIQTTVDVYGHIVPGSNRNAVNKLDDETGPELRVVSSAG